MLSRSEASLTTFGITCDISKTRLWRNVISMQYCVYILTNASRTLYIGVTNNIERRMHEHRNKLISGFTKKYNLTILVYFESTSDIRIALEREKQIKGWTREKKIALIEAQNPMWQDLSKSWF